MRAILSTRWYPRAENASLSMACASMRAPSRSVRQCIATSAAARRALGLPCRVTCRERAATTRSRTAADMRGRVCARVARDELRRRQRRHVERQVDAVEQRPRHARAVARDLVGRARAASARIAEPAAWAGVHRGDELELRRETSSGAPRARCGSRPTRAARAALRARGDPTPAARRGTARRDARARSRRDADCCRRRPAPRRSRCDAARETDACPSATP